LISYYRGFSSAGSFELMASASTRKESKQRLSRLFDSRKAEGEKVSVTAWIDFRENSGE